MRRLDPNLSVVDHILAALACLLAVYSISMSLGNVGLAAFMTIGTVVTATTGFALSKLVRGKKIGTYDSYLWAVTGVAATGFINPLNDLLPGGGFPFELIAASILCWILLIGNLFAWRDQTLIFLSLPCIALFGLVGTFDTFTAATAMFFLFMLTIAVLYARIHQRSMIDRARRAGIEEPELLRRGPWKWMAGPEWALASALVIILFSFMGGPVLQTSLSNVAGRVTVTLPQQTQQNSPTNAAQQNSDVLVGTGPTRLTDQQVIKVKIDRPRYLRLNAFSTYTGGGWRSTPISLPSGSPLVTRIPDAVRPERGPNGGLATWPGYDAPPHEPITDGEAIKVTLKESNNNFTSLLAPGPITEVMAPPEGFTFLPQGWVMMANPIAREDSIDFYSLVPNESPEGKAAKLPPALLPIEDLYLNKENVPSRVRDLAYRVTQGADSDYEKAIAIKEAIETRVVYNIRARETPEGKDPVENFLFESKEGYCDLFASAMATMARSVGLPTRYVIGYIINTPEKDDDGFFTVRARDYHAWCEIYFEDIGWIAFDPTEGAPSVDGGERGALGSTDPWYKSQWFIGALVVVLIAALLAPIYFAVRQRGLSPEQRAERTTSDVVRLHTNFYRAIEKFVGAPKRFSQTTREYVATVGPKLGDVQNQALALVGTFESAMYSQRPADKERVGEIARQVAELRTALGSLKKQKP